MAEFDPNKYFQSRSNALPKTVSVEQARANKIEQLDNYLNATAAGQQFSNPDRSFADIAGDVGITALKSAIAVPEAAVGLADLATLGHAGKALEELGYRPGDAKKILDGWLSDAQKEANLKVKAADGFISTLEAAIENPSTIATAVGESLAPMLAGGLVARGLMAGAKVLNPAAKAMGAMGPEKAGMLARVVGDKAAPVVAGALGEGIMGAGSAAESIRQETEDGLMTGKQVGAALGSGAGTALLGFAGGKLSQKLGVPDLDTMMAKGQLDSSAGFMKALVGGGISEGVFEEMPQSAQEQMWQNYALGKPLTEGVGGAAAMGLLTGAAMGGVGGGMGGISGLVEGTQARLATAAKARKEKEEATKTGDISKLADSPSDAVSALLGNTTQENTSPEQREENLKKAEQVIARLEAERNALAKGTSSVEEKKAQIAEYQAELAAEPADSEDADLLRDAIASLEQQLAKPVDTKAQKQAKNRLALLDGELAKARATFKALTDEVLTPEVAESTVAQVSAGRAEDADTQKAVVRVLSMAANNPDLLTTETVTALASDKNNALNQDQRNYLASVASSRAALAALKDMEEVHKDVLYGGKGYRGIEQYRKEIHSALKAQDQRTVRRLMTQLGTFAAGHQNKAEAAVKAMGTGIGTPIAKIKGVWQALPRGTRIEDVPGVASNEFRVMNSGKMVQLIQKETKAVNAALAEMQGAMNVFSVPVTSGAKNVSNPPQQGSTAKAPVTSQEPKATQSPANQAVSAGASVSTAGRDSGTSDAGKVSGPLPWETDEEYASRTGKPVPAAKKQDVGPGPVFAALFDKTQVQTTKAAVKVVFDATGLKAVGSFMEYSQYLAQYFEKSAVNKVLFHYSSTGQINKDQKLNKAEKALFFFDTVKNAQAWSDWTIQGGPATGEILLAKVNVSPKQTKNLQDGLSGTEMVGAVTDAMKEGAHAAVATNVVDWGTIGTQVAVNEGEIVWLGSEQDIAQFAKWVKSSTVTVPDSIKRMDDGPLPWETDEEYSTRTEGNSVTSVGTESTESSVERSPGSDATPDEAVLSEGKLSGFAQEHQEGATVSLSKHFTQVEKREGDRSGRPLVAVKDWLSNLVAGKTYIDDFLDGVDFSDPVNASKSAAIELFVKKATAWQKTIQAALPRTRKQLGWEFQDPMTILLNGENGRLDLDENVKTAMAYAVFSFVGREAGSPAWANEKQLNGILDRPEEWRVPPGAYELLGQAGKYEDLVADSLGSVVMQALGLKARKDAPQNYEAKLKAVLGKHVLELMIREGLVTRTTVPFAELQALREHGLNEKGVADSRKKYGTVEENERVVSNFIAIARNEDGFTPVDTVLDIEQAVKSSSGVLDSLFKTQTGLVLPSLEPITTLDVGTGVANQQAPKYLQKVLLKNQARPRTVRLKMLNIFGALNEQQQDAVIGVTEENEEFVHVVNERSVIAKNESLRRQLRNFMAFVTDVLEVQPEKLNTAFYLPFSVWQQQRVGIDSTVVNPQASKIVRYLVTSPNWKTTVNSSDEKSMYSFWIRVGEGLGLKPERFSAEDALVEAKKKANKPEIQAGVKALQKIVQGKELTEQESDAIVAAVTAGEEALHTLDVLLAMAEEAVAREAAGDGQYSFDVEMMGEVDGVANGTMFNHLLLGAKHTEDELAAMLEQGGFYTEDSAYREYNEYRSDSDAGNLDIYESTLTKIYEHLKMYVDPQLLSTFEAVGGKLIDEDKGKIDRNLVKDALNPLAFGSSLTKMVSTMADGFVGKVYAGFENLAKDGASPEEVLEYVRQVNRLIGKPGLMLKEGMKLGDYMNTRLHVEAEKSIKEVYTETIGEVVESVIKTEFADFLEKRDTLVRASNDAYKLYEAVYSGVRQVYVQELLDAGELELSPPGQKTGERKQVGDLSLKQEEELARRVAIVAPTLKAVMSLKEKDSRSHILLMDEDSGMSNDPLYESETRFTGKDGKNKTASAKGMELKRTNPGVKVVSAAAHSFDSGVSHYVQDKLDVLNIHDANGAGLGMMEEVAVALNEGTWNAALNYSQTREMYDSLVNMVMRIRDNTRSNGMYPEVAENLKNMFVSGNGEPAILGQLRSIKHMAYEADSKKLGLMSKMVSVAQYAYLGGNYLVTEADRKKAAEKLAVVERTGSEVPKGIVDAVLEIVTAIQESTAKADNKTEATTANETPEASAPKLSNSAAAQILTAIGSKISLQVLAKLKEIGTDLAKAMADLSPVDASALRTAIAAQLDASKPEFWGKVGTASIAPDPAMVAFFEANPQPTVGKVIAFLEQHMGGMNQSRHVKFQRILLEQLKRTVNKDMPIHYIEPNTPPSLAAHTPPGAARGWYVSNGEGIFVLSPDFKDSAMTPEVLLHELVHAALVEAVANPNKRTQGMINELNKLYEKAKGLVESGGLKDYVVAVSDLDEFIAWGMTNRAFQKDVLSKLEMGSRTKRNGLIDGMKEFINRITGILFAGSSLSESEQARNGVSVLVSNVSGLFADVAEKREKQSKNTTSKAEARVLKMASTIRSYTTQQLFASLKVGSVSTEFQERLSGLLDKLVTRLHGPGGALKASLMQDQTISPLDVWLKAVATNEAPFASDVVAAGMANESEQQAFVIEQVEATVRAAVNGNESQTKLVYGALDKLYTEAKQKISVQDFLAAGFTADQYKFVFTPVKTVGDRSDYLSRFAALGLAHEGFNKLLQFSTALDEKEAKTIAEKVQRVFEQILELFQRSMTGTWGGQKAATKLEVLVGKLVDIESAHRRRQIKRAMGNGLADKAEEGVEKAFDYLREKAIAASQSDFIRKNGSAYVRAAGAMAGVVAGDKLDAMLAVIQKIRDKELEGRPGVLAGLVNGVLGSKEVLQALTRAKTNHDRKRKAIMTNTAKTLLGAFVNGGQDLGKKEKDSITQAFLRTGVHHLVGSKSMQELSVLLGKGKALDDAIAAAEQALGSFGKRAPYFINQANVLGYYAATGKVADANMMNNAYNIVEMTGTPYYGQLKKSQVDAAVPLVNQLVSLYALRYTDGKVLSKAKDVLQKELARTDGMNGVELAVLTHKKMEEESLNKLFNGNPALMFFAYTPDIYNPNIGVTVANEAEGEELLLQGYRRVFAAQKDPSDPDTETKHVYVMQDAGLQPYLAGAINLAGMKAKGSKLHNGFVNLNNQEGVMNAATQAAMNNNPLRNASMRRLFQAGPVQDLTKVKTSFMAPVVNEKGAIVNWRYLMTQESKDSLLERTNGFDKVLGTLASATYDKADANEQNKHVMQVLLDLYNQDGKKNPESYIEISASTADADMREIWNMLPKATKELVRDVWKKDSLMVRKDSLDLVFGYRKMSLAKAFEKDATARNELEKLMVFAIEYPLYLSYKTQGMSDAEASKKAEARAPTMVVKGERIWQELVQEAKDIIVVKTGVVLVGNIISNLSLLWAHGVPLRDMMHHHLVAMKGATTYIKNTEELSRLRLLLDSGIGGTDLDEVRAQIVRLENALARNPVGELIEAGLMPSIVEDVAADDDEYSYKSALVRKVERKTQSWNKQVISAGRIAYMAHDTKLYQGLSRATQLSDFVARYTLYQHLTTQKKRALSKEAAVQEASEAFVNYDIPMHRVLQYLDDMGLMMFTKYFLRIQRVIQKLAKEHPGRMLSLFALNGYHDLGPIILDSSALFRIGNNPFSTGPLTLLESLDELATVTAPMALIK